MLSKPLTKKLLAGLCTVACTTLLTLTPAHAATYNGSGPGTSTINAGGGADYTSLAAAITDLNGTALTGGDWTFEIVGNLTEGVLSITQNTNGNTVIIKPAAAETPTVGITSIQILNTANVTIDGSNSGGTSQDMTLNTSGANGVLVDEESDGFTIQNCLVNSTGTFLRVDSNGASNLVPQNGTVDNCDVSCTYFIISEHDNAGTPDGQTGWVFSNNTITTNNNQVFRIRAMAGHLISENVINQTRNSSDQAQMHWTLLRSINDPYSVTFDSNVVNFTHNASGGAVGMFAFAINDNGDNIITNNFINLEATGGGRFAAGANVVTVADASANISFLHNSVYMRSSNPRQTEGGTSNFSIIQIPSTNYDGTLDIRNNAMVNGWIGDASPGSAVIGLDFDKGATGATVTSDYNLAWLVAGATGAVIGHENGVDYATMADWAAGSGLDANSSDAEDPTTLWTSATDYHFAVQPGAADPDWIGTPIGSVTDDIDGDARDGLIPTKGADEATTLDVKNYIDY